MIFWVGRFKKSLFSAAISKLLKGKCWFWPGTVDLKSLILGPTRVKAALAKVLFKHYESLSVLLAPSILMPSLTLGNPTCLIVDAGYQETKVIPVFEGVPVLKVGSRMTRIQVTLEIWSLCPFLRLGKRRKNPGREFCIKKSRRFCRRDR